MNHQTDAILVADDDEATRALLVRLVEALGFTAVARGNGEEVMHFITRYQPRLAIVDAYMPWLDGIQAIQRLRAQGHQTPIILISTECTRSMERVLDRHTWYLSKPFTPSEFNAFLSGVMAWRF